MSDYEEQIDDETKVAIGAEFMKYAPPGEFNEVYNDVAKLLANEELLKQATSEVKWSWLINYYSLKHNRVKTVKTSLSNRSIVQSVNLDIFWSFAITVTNFTGFQTNKTIRRDITVKIEFLLKFNENNDRSYSRAVTKSRPVTTLYITGDSMILGF